MQDKQNITAAEQAAWHAGLDEGRAQATGSVSNATLEAAPAAVAVPDAAAIIRNLVDHIERNTCEHHETYRGGAIWEVCSDCGAKWADDQGGKPSFKCPDAVERAREFLLAATPADHIADAGKMVAAPDGWKLVPVLVPDSAFPWVSGGYSTDYLAHDPRDQKIIEDRAQRTWEAILDGIAAAPAAAPDALRAIAIEELAQLGYTFDGDKMMPPDFVGELMHVVQTAPCGCRAGTCETKSDRACRMKAEISAAAPVVLPEPEHDDAYTRRVIEALHENGDPVSVDAAEEMERLRALLATATGLPAQAAASDAHRELYFAAYGLCDGICEDHPAIGDVMDAGSYGRLCSALAKLDAHYGVTSPDERIAKDHGAATEHPTNGVHVNAVASIYVTAGGAREFDDWRVSLPFGNHLLYTAPQAQADARDDAELLDAMERQRISVVPEYEGPWDAEVYNGDEKPNHRGSGSTPREAIRAAIAASKE